LLLSNAAVAAWGNTRKKIAMAETFFQKLKGIDPGVAAAYLKATGNKPDGIDKRGAEILFKQVMDGDKITSREAKALVFIFDNGKLSPDARELLEKKLSEDGSINAIERGAAKQITADDPQMADYRNALSSAVVGKIDFWSPNTGIHYTPSQYYTIRHLVERGNIKVFEVEDEELGRAFKLGLTGEYILNQLVIFQDARGKTDLIVHESTHAIQDWLNTRSANKKFMEADAYVAEALAHSAQARNFGPPTIVPTLVAFEQVVPQIIDRPKVAKSDSAWQKAWSAVVESVERTVPPDEKSQNILNQMTVTGKKQKETLDILEAIASAEQTAARMTPPGSGPGGELTEKDKNVLREFMKRGAKEK
jgi:hypothetical protein